MMPYEEPTFDMIRIDDLDVITLKSASGGSGDEGEWGEWF